MTCKTSSPPAWQRALVGTAFFFACSAAFAEVHLSLQRLSDTEVALTGSGALGSLLPAENRHSLLLENPFSVRPAALTVHTIFEDSDLHAGSFYFNFGNAAGSGFGASFSNTIYIGRDIGVLPFPQIPSGEPLAGTMFLRLSAGESFAPVGASGKVFWGTTTGNITGVLSGSWEMVAASPVPEPSSSIMMAGGVLLLISLRARSKVASGPHHRRARTDA